VLWVVSVKPSGARFFTARLSPGEARGLRLSWSPAIATRKFAVLCATTSVRTVAKSVSVRAFRKLGVEVSWSPGSSRSTSRHFRNRAAPLRTGSCRVFQLRFSVAGQPVSSDLLVPNGIFPAAIGC